VPGPPPRLLILDACVLIDFCDADPSVLRVVSRAVGAIHVATPVLAEVEQLDESTAESLGLRVVEPPLSMFAAAARKRGRLSPRDHLCLLMAKAEGWTCVSNDRALRTVWVADGVDVLWGLEMMGLAVASRAPSLLRHLSCFS
jgi:predicted nucleic acid-binding protein